MGIAPYSDPRWLTFKQCSEKGGKVRKGEKSTLIVFWKLHDVTRASDEGDEVERQIPFLRYYTVFNAEQCDVFNAEQCDGLDLPTIETRNIDVVAEAEAIVAAMPNRPQHQL